MTTRTRAAAVAGLASLAGVAGSYLVAGPTAGFIGTQAGSFVVNIMPGMIVSVSITTLGNLASVLALVATIILVVVTFALVAAVGIQFGRRVELPYTGAFLAGVGGWWASTYLTGAPIISLGVGIPMAGIVALAEHGTPDPTAERIVPERREIIKLTAVVGILGIASFFSRFGRKDPVQSLAVDEATRDDIDSNLALGRERSLDFEALSSLVTEVGEFYEVDINNINPRIDRDQWHLRVTGAVEQPLELSYEDIRMYAPENRFMTLRCVGERLNGHKMDTAFWTGVSASVILDEAGPTSNCECVMLHADDGYFEEFPLAALRSGMFAYGMNGKALPVRHGSPLRALVPGHWGEINVKWLTEIELLEREATGYWEKRGWHGTGPVNTVAKIHAVDQRGGGRVSVGGHAYAGLRGIRAVQVSTDGGETWQEARLSAPLPGEDVWRQWQLDLQLSGPTEVTARAIEADGSVQPRDPAEPFPSGPSGWVTRTVRPNG